MYKQYNLSHTRKNYQSVLPRRSVSLSLFPHGFAVIVHHLVELCEARNDRDADLCLQEALSFGYIAVV